ncbi:MFS transporter [Porticoccaceae bacterium]|nr:MFS transporter [Porticoccaceae bacterium]
MSQDTAAQPLSSDNRAHQHIPLDQKIAWGIGMLANQMFPAALGIFMVLLVQSLGMSPLLWSLIFLIPKLIDAITDPLMGYISDHTVSRWGKRRPYVFIGAIISGFSFVMMWQLSAENTEMYNFYYFLTWCSIFWIGMTIFSVPYVAMGYEMSSDYHERTRLMAIAQWIGQWAWVIAPWFWIILYDPSWFESATEGAKTLSIWVAGICMSLALVPAIFCTFTNTAEDSNQSAANDGTLMDSVRDFGSGIMTTLRNRAFRKVCLATFLVFNAFQVIAAFSWFIIVYYMNAGDPVAAGVWPTLFGSVGALFTCFLVIPVVNWCAQTYGKLNTFIASQSVSLLGYILLWWGFSPEDPWMMFIPLPLFAFGIGGLFTIMMSMTADICDMDELETGERREGTFGAIYWWMVKFGAAVAGAGSGLILSLIGFDQNVAVQSDETLALLRLSYILIPCIGTSLAIFVMRNYDLDEQKANEIRAQLDARAAAAS